MTDPKQTSEQELLPCPFCGGEAELDINDMSIYCNTCDGQVTNFTKTKTGLQEAWNTRPNPTNPTNPTK
jgi:Lar family restriction alleviation protein